MVYKTRLNNGIIFLSPDVSSETSLNIYVENIETSTINSIIEVLTPTNLASIDVYTQLSQNQDVLTRHYGNRKYNGMFTHIPRPDGIVLMFGLDEYSSLEARVAALEEKLKEGVE